MENDFETYVKLKLFSLPRINFAVISRSRNVEEERIDNNYNELYYIESGSVTFTVNGHALTVHAGEYILFPAGTPYERCKGDEAVISVSVAFFLDDGISEFVPKDRIVFDKVDNVQFVENEVLYFPALGKMYADEKAYKLLKNIIACYDAFEEYSNVNVSSLTISLFVELANNALAKIKGLEKEDAVSAERYCKKIDAYIENNYSRVITMSIVARYMELHENYISYIYRKCRGMTVMKKLTLYRLEKAKELLAKNKYTIKEVSEMVGYKDCKYFIAVFKKFEDITPGKYVSRFYGDKVYSYAKIED